MVSHFIIYRTFKDVKRRATQSVLATVGVADSTKDEDFDAHMEHFNTMIQDMNECMHITILCSGLMIFKFIIYKIFIYQS